MSKAPECGSELHEHQMILQFIMLAIHELTSNWPDEWKISDSRVKRELSCLLSPFWLLLKSIDRAMRIIKPCDGPRGNNETRNER
jgi:hypothetical protein